MVRMHVFQHVPFEGVGYIETYCRERGILLSHTRVFAKDTYPGINDFDCLLVMGGPMSVYEEKLYPWIADEKKIIADAVAARKKVVGICLGAQLLASALGGRVYPDRQKEIGWFPVGLTAPARSQGPFKGVAGTFTAFHWHGDTFDLPAGAVHCASSEACRNQAFVYHDDAVGLQFHCEATVDGVRTLIDNCEGDLVEGRFVQGRAEILSRMDAIAPSNGIMGRILDGLLNSGGAGKK